MWGNILVSKLICLENKSEIGKAFNHYDLEVVITLMLFSDQSSRTRVVLCTLHCWAGGSGTQGSVLAAHLALMTSCEPRTLYVHVEDSIAEAGSSRGDGRGREDESH